MLDDYEEMKNKYKVNLENLMMHTCLLEEKVSQSLMADL